VRCDRCLLVQFRTTNNLCRRCHTCLDADEPEVAATPEPIAAPSHGNGNGTGRQHLQVALAIRSLRHRAGLSQRQLALRMQVPRTYVSKIENEKAMPTLSSLERLAKALEVTVPDLLSGGSPTREQLMRELMTDEFITQLLPFVSKLDGMQRQSLLAQVRDLTLRPRRSA